MQGLKERGDTLKKFDVQVYSTREFHNDEIDYSFDVRVKASDTQEAMQKVADECVDTGCNEQCEVHGANEVKEYGYS